MNLAEYSRAGNPVVVDLGDNHLRLASEVFEIPGGIVFADSGWPDAAGRHPFHIVHGKVEPLGAWPVWRLRDELAENVTVIRWLTDEDSDADYRETIREHYALDGTRTQAREKIVALFTDLKEVSD